MKIQRQNCELGRQRPYCVLTREMSPEDLVHAPGLQDLAGFIVDEVSKAIEIGASFARATGSTALDFLHTARESFRLR